LKDSEAKTYMKHDTCWRKSLWPSLLILKTVSARALGEERRSAELLAQMERIDILIAAVRRKSEEIPASIV